MTNLRGITRNFHDSETNCICEILTSLKRANNYTTTPISIHPPPRHIRRTTTFSTETKKKKGSIFHPMSNEDIDECEKNTQVATIHRWPNLRRRNFLLFSTHKKKNLNCMSFECKITLLWHGQGFASFTFFIFFSEQHPKNLNLFLREQKLFNI